MKPGDLVINKNSQSGELGLFIGLKVFDDVYECAEVMWSQRPELNGGKVLTIQKDLIEVTHAK